MIIDKIKIINRSIRQRPFLLGILAAILILLLIPWKKPAKQTVKTDQTIELKALNPNLQPSTSFADLNTEALNKKINVYEVPTPPSEQLDKLFEPIAQEFDFPNQPESIEIDQEPYLFWDNTPNFLNVNLNTGSFTLDLHPQSASPSSPLATIDAINIAKNWLIKHNLINDESKVETHEIENKLGGSYKNEAAGKIQVSFYPTVDNLPIFTPNTVDPPISVIITNQGEIYSVYYRLPPFLFTLLPTMEKNSQKLLTDKQIQEAIENNQPVITQLKNSEEEFLVSTTPIKTVTYESIVLGYTNEIFDNQLVPVFQLTGTAKTDTGESVNVTAYLPALAE